MNSKIQTVLNGWKSLSSEEKELFLSITKNPSLLKESVASLEQRSNKHSINLGPTGQHCPYCNR